MTEATLQKLREAFLFGCTDEEACLFADIGTSTFYAYQEAHPEFKEEKEQLKHNPVMLARKTVVGLLQIDGDLALKYLERKKKDEFSTKSEVENSGNLQINIVKYDGG